MELKTLVSSIKKLNWLQDNKQKAATSGEGKITWAYYKVLDDYLGQKADIKFKETMAIMSCEHFII